MSAMRKPADPRTDFDAFFVSEVEPGMLDYVATRETVRHRIIKGRRLKLLGTVMAGIGIALAFVSEALSPQDILKTSGIGLIGLGILVRFLSSKYAAREEGKLGRTIRSTVVQPVAQAFEMRFHGKGGDFSTRDFGPLLPTYTSATIDDVVSGSFEGQQFEFRDLRLVRHGKNSSQTVFEGMIGQVDGRIDSGGAIVVTPDRTMVGEFFAGLLDDRPVVAFPDHHSFEETFSVRADNPDKARELLSPEVRKALSNTHRSQGSERTAYLIDRSGVKFSISHGRDIAEVSDSLDVKDFRLLTERMVREFEQLQQLVITLRPIFDTSNGP
jgi:hypothetical protein